MAKTKEKSKEPAMTLEQQALLDRARKNIEKDFNAQKDNFEKAEKDLKFCNNEGHWNDKILAERTSLGKTSLTFNHMVPFIRDTMGEQRESRPNSKIKPVSKDATKEVAAIMEGYLRNRKHECKADTAYDNSFAQQMQGGFGRYQIRADFETDDVTRAIDKCFDQTLFIKPLLNQFSVVFDANAIEWHKNDGERMTILTYFDKDSFEKKWPGVTPSSFNTSNTLWYPDGKNKFCVAEYYEKEHSKETIYQLSDGTVIKKDQIPETVERKAIGAEWPNPNHNSQDPNSPQTLKILKKRKVDSYKIMRHLLCGHAVLEDPVEWPCPYWGVVPVDGDQIVIKGKVTDRSLVRFAIDPQMAYNMSRSCEIDATMQAHKSFVTGTAAMFENYEEQWTDLKGVYAYKPYNPDPMMPGMRPERFSSIDPSYIQAVAQSSLQAKEEIRQTIGPNVLLPRGAGAGLPDVSGAALGKWQSEGDVSTYVFVDNLQRAIEWGDLVCVKLMQRIMDTEREITIRKTDGSTEQVVINQKVRDPQTMQEVVINDFTKGEYTVETTMGPSYAAQRAELANLLVRFTDGMPELKMVTADILAAMLFDMSQNVAGAHGGVLDEFVKRTKKFLLKRGVLGPDDLKEEELKEFAPMLMMMRSKPMPPLVAAKLKESAMKAFKFWADAVKALEEGKQISTEAAWQHIQMMREVVDASIQPMQQPHAPQAQVAQPQGQLPGPQGMPMQ